jgi:outer membrane protein assembly factor BamB
VVRTSKRPELIVASREYVIAYDTATGEELWRSDGVGVNPVPSPVVGHNLVIITAGAGEKHAKAIRLGGSGEISNTPEVAWQYDKGTAHIASPILYGDYLYLLTDHGIITCLDVETGRVKYRDRVPGSVYFTASPVAYEGKILFTSEEGYTFVIKAGPVFELMGKNSIGEAVYASPAISGGRIFIRGENTLYAIRGPAGN